MTTHQFALGQAVRLKNGFRTSGILFRVTALLPASDNSLQYRIRSDDEKFERMVTEFDLERTSPVTDDANFAQAAAPPPV